MRKIAFMLVVILCLTQFCACGGKTDSGTSEKEASSGTLYDTGVFSASLPEGWYNYIVLNTDGQKDPEGKFPASTTQIHFAKGAKNDEDAWSSPYVDIEFLAQPMDELMYTMFAIESSFDASPVVEEVKIDVAGTECSGYHGNIREEEMSIYYLPAGEVTFQITVAHAGTLNMEDTDVMAILTSLKAD